MAKTPEVEEKKDDSIARAVADAMKEALPEVMKQTIPAALMAMEQVRTQSAHQTTLQTLKAKQALEEKCHICKQTVGDGKTRGCGGGYKRDEKGEYVLVDGKRVEDPSQFHVQMILFPSDPIAVQQYDGFTLNGVWYKSQGPDHKIWVPKSNDFASQMVAFERDQRIQQVGRKHMRNSGSISPHGQNTQAPTFNQ